MQIWKMHIFYVKSDSICRKTTDLEKVDIGEIYTLQFKYIPEMSTPSAEAKQNWISTFRHRACVLMDTLPR